MQPLWLRYLLYFVLDFVFYTLYDKFGLKPTKLKVLMTISIVLIQILLEFGAI